MKEQMFEVLYSAIQSEYGIVVETNDANRLRQKLYAICREHSEFKHLSFLISPLNGADLWILNKEQASAEE